MTCSWICSGAARRSTRCRRWCWRRTRPAVIAEYRTDEGSVGAICLVDAEFAIRTAGALTMVPPAAVADTLRKGDSPTPLENFREIVNILAQLLNSPRTSHLRLAGVHVVPGRTARRRVLPGGASPSSAATSPSRSTATAPAASPCSSTRPARRFTAPVGGELHRAAGPLLGGHRRQDRRVDAVGQGPATVGSQGVSTPRRARPPGRTARRSLRPWPARRRRRPVAGPGWPRSSPSWPRGRPGRNPAPGGRGVDPGRVLREVVADAGDHPEGARVGPAGVDHGRHRVGDVVVARPAEEREPAGDGERAGRRRRPARRDRVPSSPSGPPKGSRSRGRTGRCRRRRPRRRPGVSPVTARSPGDSASDHRSVKNCRSAPSAPAWR